MLALQQRGRLPGRSRVFGNDVRAARLPAGNSTMPRQMASYVQRRRPRLDRCGVRNQSELSGWGVRSPILPTCKPILRREFRDEMQC